MLRCRKQILDAVKSLDTTKSAAHLNIGVKALESLAKERVLPRLKNRSHRRRHFLPADLDHLLALAEKNTTQCSDIDNAEFCSIADACFLYHVTTGQVTRLLIGEQLRSSKQLVGIAGFQGIRIKREELKTAMKIFTDDHIAPRELSKHLGLTFDQMRALRQLHLLPSFPAPKGHGYRSTKSISKTILNGFLRKYQTIATAARHLEIEEKELRSKIEKPGIVFAQEGVGLPIFYRSDLLN